MIQVKAGASSSDCLLDTNQRAIARGVQNMLTENDPVKWKQKLKEAAVVFLKKDMEEIATTQPGGRATAAGPFKGRAEVRTIPD